MLSRRHVLYAFSALAAGSSFAPQNSNSQTRQALRISDTTAMHEMPIYSIPEFIGPQYDVSFLNLGSSGTSMLAALLNGMCDAISSANTYLITAQAEGASIVPICGLAGRGQAIGARADKGIKKLEDLKGKKLVTKRMTSAHVMMQIALKSVGIDPLKDVEILDFGQPAGFSLMLESGQADAGQVWEPFASIAAEKPGLFKLELDRFFDLTWKTHSSLYVPEKLLKEKPDAVKDLVRATVRAVEANTADRARFTSIVAKKIGQDKAVLSSAMANCAPRVEMDATVFYRVAEEMYALGIIKKDVAREVEGKLNYSILAEVTGRTPQDLGFVSYADYKAGKRAAIKG